MNRFFTFALLILTSVVYAQDGSIFSVLSEKENGGEVRVFQDADLKTVFNDYVAKKSQEEGTQGYRVQIFFGTGHRSRNNAYQVRNSFVSKYQDLPVHVIFQEPYFKVRVGDFRNKTEALKVLNLIEADFEGAFIVKDYIKFPPLFKEEKEEEQNTQTASPK